MAKKPAQAKSSEGGKVIHNRRTGFEYELLERYEAGVMLQGSEVKSIWLGRVNMTDAYCDVREGELWLVNLDVEPYEHSSHFQPERRRDRKLLLHRKEIDLISRKSREKGLTIVPTKIYFKGGRVKIDIALARGKRDYDKRHQIAEKDTRREMERARSERH
jgi:SsrA-binding protein